MIWQAPVSGQGTLVGHANQFLAVHSSSFVYSGSTIGTDPTLGTVGDQVGAGALAQLINLPSAISLSHVELALGKVNAGTDIVVSLQADSGSGTPSGIPLCGAVIPAEMLALGLQELIGAPTVTPEGTAGTTTYNYQMAAQSMGQVVPSAVGSTTTGNATLNSTNYILISWSAVPLPAGSPGNLVYDSNLTNAIASVGATWHLIGASVGTANGDYNVQNPGTNTASWYYIGTGAASGYTLVSAVNISVIPGATYTLVASGADGSATTSGAAGWSVTNTARSSYYASMTIPVVYAGDLSVTFTVPPGVTLLQLFCDTSNCTVTARAKLVFGTVQLTQTSAVQPYEPGPLPTYNIYRDAGAYELIGSTTALGFQDTGQIATNQTPPDLPTQIWTVPVAYDLSAGVNYFLVVQPGSVVNSSSYIQAAASINDVVLTRSTATSGALTYNGSAWTTQTYGYGVALRGGASGNLRAIADDQLAAAAYPFPLKLACYQQINGRLSSAASWTMRSLTAPINLLCRDDANFEYSIGTMIAVNATVAQAGIYNGYQALEISGTSAGAASAETAGYPVVAGQTYSATVLHESPSGTSTIALNIIWLNSSGSIISQSSGTVTNPTGAYQQLSVTGIAPATAVKGYPQLYITSYNGEKHYIAQLGLFQGTNILWSLPGLGMASAQAISYTNGLPSSAQ